MRPLVTYNWKLNTVTITFPCDDEGVAFGLAMETVTYIYAKLGQTAYGAEVVRSLTEQMRFREWTQ